MRARGYEVTERFPGPRGGRLGQVCFQVGDIILRVGNRDFSPGMSLDTLVQRAKQEGYRTVRVRDVNTSMISTLSF